ncbi:hypothetical protein B296_00032466 [Ensete ventricosum]|uniref:Uncharacterized protein n=1 Tax=Ensete ventricosum TaxID=4639 RepID=A0A427A4H6_ENSVE|nr:hypothetical protein B296_00032466 [Ensete ventricosum]
MTVGSQKGKRRRRPQPSSDLPASDPMAPTAASDFGRCKRSRRYCCRREASLPVALVALCTLLFVYITWKKMTVAVSVSVSTPPRFYSFDIVNEFPHDPDAFTQARSVSNPCFRCVNFILSFKSQGLVYGGNETLFESTGLYHRSSVRQVLLQTGKVQVSYQMDGSYFGEGLTLLGERQGLLKSGHTAIDVLNGIAWDKETNRLFGKFVFIKSEIYVFFALLFNNLNLELSLPDSSVSSSCHMLPVTGKLWPKLYQIHLRPVTGQPNGRIEDLCLGRV